MLLRYSGRRDRPHPPPSSRSVALGARSSYTSQEIAPFSQAITHDDDDEDDELDMLEDDAASSHPPMTQEEGEQIRKARRTKSFGEMTSEAEEDQGSGGGTPGDGEGGLDGRSLLPE